MTVKAVTLAEFVKIFKTEMVVHIDKNLFVTSGACATAFDLSNFVHYIEVAY